MAIYRRISFWGGPGAGKTSMAAKLYAEMKAGAYKVYFSEESVNPWIYQGRVPPEGYDDLLLFAQQIYAEEVRMNPRKGGAEKPQATAADYVVTDCPPLMCCVYNQRRGVPYHNHLVKIALEYEKAYPSLNIFMGRPANYDEGERFHSRKEAEEIDQKMRDCLRQHHLKFREIPVTGAGEVVQYVLSEIGSSPTRKHAHRRVRNR